MNSLVKTLRQDQNAKLADFEEMEKYRVGFEKTSGLIEAERERNNQDRFRFLSFNPLLIPYESYVTPISQDTKGSRSKSGSKMKTVEAET